MPTVAQQHALFCRSRQPVLLRAGESAWLYPPWLLTISPSESWRGAVYSARATFTRVKCSSFAEDHLDRRGASRKFIFKIIDFWLARNHCHHGLAISC